MLPDPEVPTGEEQEAPLPLDSESVPEDAVVAEIVEATEAEGPEEATALEERLSRFEQTLAAMQETMDERLRYDNAKEAAFDRLYADLDEHKKRATGDSLRPLFRDLINLYDHIVEAIREQPGEAESLSLIREGLLEVLYRVDVEPIEYTDDQYNRSLQQVKRVVKSSNPEDDWKVAEILREGFRRDEIILRPQHVVVRRYEAPQDEGKESGTE